MRWFAKPLYPVKGYRGFESLPLRQNMISMPMIIVTKAITKKELKELALERFGDLVKAVVDVKQGIMSVGGELHSDEEAQLLENGSKQSDLWGINLYPDLPSASWLEFDSMINLRPSQTNLSRGVEDEQTRARIIQVVNSLVKDI